MFSKVIFTALTLVASASAAAVRPSLLPPSRSHLHPIACSSHDHCVLRLAQPSQWMRDYPRRIRHLHQLHWGSQLPEQRSLQCSSPWRLCVLFLRVRPLVFGSSDAERFARDFGCLNSGVNGHDVAVLTGGSWTMSRVQGIAGTQDFNDKTSSFSCSPV